VTKRSKFSVPLPSPSVKVNIVLRDIINPSNQNQSEPPWTAWLRPSSWLTDQTQDWTGRISLHSFYSDSCEDTLPLTTHHPPNQQ
jgi:hypothetical protein